MDEIEEDPAELQDTARLLGSSSTTTTTTTTTTTSTTSPSIPISPIEEEEDDDDDDEEESLEDYAGVVVTILQPVAITMLLVVWVVRTITLPGGGGTISSTMVYQEEAGDSTTTKFFGSIANALIFLAIILGTTVLFVILYKYRCLKVIYGWLMLSTCMLLGFFGGYMFYLVLYSLNLAVDWLTFSFFLWNFSVVGIIAIFWYAPTKLNQAYLIAISALLAIYFTRLPEWTTWAILAIVAIYDLFAVLCPRGPLKVLVETAQQRKEPIPALLYNASVVMMNVTPINDENNNNNIEQDQVRPVPLDLGESSVRAHPPPPPDSVISTDPPAQEHRGVKLGLGDFVFYSVLIGRAALLDMISVFTCFVAIITGLFLTLLLLAVFRKALPALPISIALGLIFYFLTRGVLMPFAFAIGSEGVFV